MTDDALAYPKYRVFREPIAETEDGHPVRMVAAFYLGYHDHDGEVWESVEEVESFTFVLKPDSDLHARAAIEAYITSCRGELPQLAEDLAQALGFSIAGQQVFGGMAGEMGMTGDLGLRVVRGGDEDGS